MTHLPDQPAAKPWFGRAVVVAFVAALVVFAVAAWQLAQPAAQVVADEIAPATVTVHTDSGAYVFTTEWVFTPADQARGLMFREEMAEDHGMVFDFGRESHRSFWMQNTLISLDIIFIHESGEVAHIAEYTTPLSEAPIPSTVPVRYVFEVVAGTADRIGLKPGDRIDLHGTAAAD
ncbi:MAG: DUF192 domain-containing protein [Bauldia sp.]|nr:DUF192 domain-containing protein [Bauldia sp.]